MIARYHDCQRVDRDCNICSLSNYGRDCRNNPVSDIAYLRQQAHMTQQQLADRAGIHIRSVQKLESGERSLPTAEAATVLALARALGTTVEELLSSYSVEA